jgi:hypothetical protein
MPRYAAKLLFQWKPEPNGRRGKLRLCEERIVTYRAASPRTAVAKAKSIGRAGQFRYRAVQGHVRFQFVGILQLMELGVESEPHDVWWELSRRVRPMERRGRLLPPERDLWVFRNAGHQPARPRRST